MNRRRRLWLPTRPDGEGTIRTKGDFGWRYAPDLVWSGGPGVFLGLAHTGTVGLLWNVPGETKGRDTLGGEKLDQTGITAVARGLRLIGAWRL